MKKLPEKLNGNNLAVFVTKEEGGKVNLSIAQVKQVIKIIAKIFVKRPFQMIALLKRLGT